MQLPTLTTARLILRPLQDTDAPYIAELAGEWAVAGNTRRVPHPYDLTMAQEFLAWQAQASRDRVEDVFAVTLRGSGNLIGCVGLVYQPQHTELGYWFGQAFWGQGYATEAAQTAIAYCRQAQAPQYFYAEHLVSNPRSGRVLERLGFQPKGQYFGEGREGAGVELMFYHLDGHWDSSRADPSFN